MFWFFREPAAAEGGEHAAAGAHHTPPIVEFVNHYIGEPVHEFQLHYTKPAWDSLFGWIKPGTKAEDLFGPYTVENAVPWYTVMFVLAAISRDAAIAGCPVSSWASSTNC